MAKEGKGKNKRNALGRGLSALLSDSGNDFIDSKRFPQAGSINEIAIDSIEINPFQPRIDFDLVALEELAASIKAQGLIQPITVRKMGNDSYQLISGERRVQAHKIAKIESIPAYIRTANDEQMLEMALSENIQREDLNPMEIALAYDRMISEIGLTMEVLGDKVGKKRATVNNYLRLLKLPPEIQLGLKEGKIGMGHARALISVEDSVIQLEIYSEALNDELSVRKVEELVRQYSGNQKPKIKTSKSGSKSEFLTSLEKALEEKFGNRVHIAQKSGGNGDIRITFDSTEDLNRILEILEV